MLTLPGSAVGAGLAVAVGLNELGPILGFTFFSVGAVDADDGAIVRAG